MCHSLHHNWSTNLWVIHSWNILRGTFSGHVKVPQSPKNSQRFFEVTILHFSLVYGRRNWKHLNETHEECFANTRTTELQTSAGMSIVWNKNAQNIDTYGSFFLIYIHLIKATHVCVKLNTFVLQNGWPKMMESIL